MYIYRIVKESRIFFVYMLGPTSVTVNDMWRMIWEQRCYSIVMVTSLVELNKVSRYSTRHFHQTFQNAQFLYSVI